MMQQEKENIIEIQGAFKRYSTNNVVLRGLNMCVEKGTIYGLLGPSGCGKTTLLSCIAGYLPLDAGSITVKLDSKKQLGYMPQDIALMELFTVSEMLHYFGKVNGLSSSQVEEKGHELLQLMELPSNIYWKRVIASLSGGQQRRVSLAVALLHDPSLLILDEPTVGLDPLINQKLWEFFVEITSKENKTLIITTHYIEEARRANMIGLMRNGVLLAESQPLKLLEDHQCDALEEVFLKLSKKQSIVCIENEEAYPKKTHVKRPKYGGTSWWTCLDYHRMGAQIYKNTCWIKRNIPMMTFMLLLPAVLMSLFCIVYSEALSGIIIGVVSEEVLPDSCLEPRNHSLVVPHCKSQSRYSCQFLTMIRAKSYSIKEYQDFDTAFDSIKHGHSHALMHFDRNYSWALTRRLSEGIITPDRYINSSMVDVHLDMAEATVGFSLEKDIRETFFDLIQFVFKDCGYNVRAAQHLVKFEKPVYGDKSPKFTDTAMPGFIIPMSFFFTTFFSASSLGSEKISGFLERCLITGVLRTELMVAHAIVQVLMATGQTAMVFTIAYGIFDMPLNGNWVLVVVFVALAEIQGMFYGFFIGTLFDEEKNVSYTAIGTVICLFLSCGMIWPLEGAHWVIYTLLRYFPLVMAVESYRSITLRAWDLTHTYIVKSIIANIGLVFFFFALFALVTKNKK